MRVILPPVLAAAVLASGCLGGGNVNPLADDLGVGASLPAQAYRVVEELRARVHVAVSAGAPVEVQAARVLDTLGVFDGVDNPIAFQVVLQPSNLLTPDTWAEIDLEKVQIPAIEVYEGHVKDKPDQLVRLTFGDEWARGSIRAGDFAYLIRVGLNGNLPFLPGEADHAAAGPSASTWTWSGGSLPERYDPPEWTDDDEEDCLRLAPPYVTPMTDSGRTSKTALRARVILDGDHEFLKQTQDDAFALMVAMINEVDSIYAHEVGIRFQVVGLHVNTDKDYFPKPTQRAPLGKLAEYWNADARSSTPRDMIHLFTGHASSYAQANCIGGAGRPQYAYTFTPLGWERTSTVFHTNAFAHELGHIFSAHHHYGNHVGATTLPADPTSAGQWLAAPGYATIMIQGYTPGFRPVFSTLSKSVIRGWAEENLKASPPAWDEFAE